MLRTFLLSGATVKQGSVSRERPARFGTSSLARSCTFFLFAVVLCQPMTAQQFGAPQSPLRADGRIVRLTVAHQHFGSWCWGYLYISPEEMWFQVGVPARFATHSFRVPLSQITAREWVVMGQPQKVTEIKFGRSTYHFWLLGN